MTTKSTPSFGTLTIRASVLFIAALSGVAASWGYVLFSVSLFVLAAMFQNDLFARAAK